MDPKNSSNNIVHIPYDIHLDKNRTLADYVYEKMMEYEDKIAQVDSHTGKTETYAELLKRSIALAQALQIKGITNEDIVGMCCYNNMDYIVVIIASIFNGSKFCAVDCTAPLPEITHCIKLTAPTLMFCEQENEDLLERAIREASINCEIITFDETEKFISMPDFVKRYKTSETFQIKSTRTLKDTGCISFTSGTSGRSKGAQVSNFGLWYAGVTGVRDLKGQERFMTFTLPYWISNLTFCMTSIYGGIARVILKSFNLQTVVKVIQDYKVNCVIFTQHVMNDLMKNPEMCNYDTSCLTYIYFGGSKIGPNLIQEIRKLFPKSVLKNGLGMTEIGGLVMLPLDELSLDENQNYSVGRPNPGVHYKVVDITTGENLGPNKPGELRIKYDGVMNGYLHQPDVTAAAFDEEGFLKTGDIIYYNDNYNFFVVDRLKEIFKFRGFHVSPVVIEDALTLHPAIQECAVIPVPHDHDGDLPMAVVRLRSQAKVTEEELIQHVQDRLTNPYHLRGGVVFVDSIPRTTSGKLRRRDLRDQILKKN